MIQFTLPRPFSANKIHSTVHNRRVKSRAYRQWIDECSWDLLRQKVKPFRTPVRIAILLPAGSRMDCDNACKPAIDLFVRNGLLPDDSRAYVAGIHADHSDEPITTVRITEAA